MSWLVEKLESRMENNISVTKTTKMFSAPDLPVQAATADSCLVRIATQTHQIIHADMLNYVVRQSLGRPSWSDHDEVGDQLGRLRIIVTEGV